MNNCKYCKADCALRGEENLKECKGHIPMTNADRILAMTNKELAEIIYKGVSSAPCDYCKHNNLHCDGSPCRGKSDVETIIDWLQQPCGGADHV